LSKSSLQIVAGQKKNPIKDKGRELAHRVDKQMHKQRATH